MSNQGKKPPPKTHPWRMSYSKGRTTDKDRQVAELREKACTNTKPT